MKRQILLLSLFPILILLNAGCSRSSNEQAELREQQGRRELLELKLRCAELGRRFEADLERSLRASGAILLRSRFAYNAELNTCIYRGGSFIKEGSHQFILDLATNEELAEYTTIGSEAGASRSEERVFGQRERELFGPKPDLSPEH